MTNRIEHITVVGGGTAGWLSAMILHRFLNIARDQPPIEVTVVESPKIPTVGVGEATVAGIVQLLNQLGIDESELFRRCNASFKLGVQFKNWALDETGAAIDYSHPFNYPTYLGGIVPAYHFNKFGPHPGRKTLAQCMVPNPALIERFKGPRRIGAKDYECDISYSYHLDAALLGHFLRDAGVRGGIRHVRDDVVDVKLDDRGYVAELILEQGGSFPVEFVVDCSGFKGLILQQTLGEPFLPFGQSLLCDRAIPVQLPHADGRRLQPCTRSTALGAGWVWRVPLYSRVGTGYVYSSAFRSDDEARAELFAHLREIGDLGQGEPDPETRVIHMRTGRTRRSWVKNCVAIGLAGGFVEPLESTAIYVMEMSARWLVGHLPDRAVNPVFAARYNELVESLYDEVREFIVSHYVTSNRPEAFWNAARNDIEVPARLRENLELWRHKLPDVTDTPASRLFNHWNYIFTLWPKGHFRGRHFPLEGSASRQDWDQFGARLGEIEKTLIDGLPDHHALLSHIRGEAAADPRAAPGRGAEVNLPAGFKRRAMARPTIPIP